MLRWCCKSRNKSPCALARWRAISTKIKDLGLRFPSEVRVYRGGVPLVRPDEDAGVLKVVVLQATDRVEAMEHHMLMATSTVTILNHDSIEELWA